MMQVVAQPSKRYKVSNVFREAAVDGLTVCRAWAFSDRSNKLSLPISPGVYDENIFHALDFVVSEAAKNKVRLILSLVNNYQNFGERPQYVDYAGVRTSSCDDFYTNAVVKQYYMNHVKGYQVGTDFIRNNLIKKHRSTTIHAYLDAWLLMQDDDAQMTFLQRWMTSQWTDSRTLLKKPMIFTEFGKSSKDPGFSIASRDSFLNAINSNIYSLARSGGIGGCLVWQLVAKGMESYSDGYEIDLFQTPSISSIISQHSRQVTTLEHKMSRP
ncbi:UNVERIFIED_CONTAM: Mannan endo-1,4-beta-mannosidase 2 [Sesamum radiatum]|uniref:mannan endo-1,4-beta-mannosidase n=1 Tax=Sesamum radiatum TaxID=300843 RepID=A0AAW2KRA2_SESRA